MKTQKIKTCVGFKADFEKDTRDQIPGRDLAEFLALRLRENGFQVNSVENEEFAFIIKCLSGSIAYEIMVCLSTEDQEHWEVTCPPTLGLFKRLLGKSENQQHSSLINAIDQILQQQDSITSVKWYGDYFDRMDDHAGPAGSSAELIMSEVGKYYYKVGPYMFVAGFALIVIAYVFGVLPKILGPIGLFCFFIAVGGFVLILFSSFLLGLIVRINKARTEGLKKHWRRILFYLAVILCFVIGFALPTIIKLIKD